MKAEHLELNSADQKVKPMAAQMAGNWAAHLVVNLAVRLALKKVAMMEMH